VCIFHLRAAYVHIQIAGSEAGSLEVSGVALDERGRTENIESLPVWDNSCFINEPYANMLERAISSEQS